MKIKDMRLLSTGELKTKLEDAQHELMNLRFQVVTGQLTDTSRLKVMRRDVASFKTLIHERELGINVEGEK
jgi:large subunit ribosomal protein L29